MPKAKVERSRAEIEAAFWARTDKNGPTVRPELGPCWIWTAGRTGSRNGYGCFTGKEWGNMAHRFSYILHNGPIPGTVWVCHKCDNPICVRPDHLFPGDVHINTADRTAKGRSARGANGGTTKFSDTQVSEIRAAYLGDGRARKKGQGRSGRAVGGSTIPELAQRFGVSQSQVWRIVRGLSR